MLRKRSSLRSGAILLDAELALSLCWNNSAGWNVDLGFP